MITAIIQARMCSTRFPEKVLKTVVGKPLLAHIVERLKNSKYLEQIVVATTINERDKSIIEFCKKNNICFFVGSEADVLDRYYQTAKKFKIDVIVRITSDDPLIDPIIVDEVIHQYMKNKDKLDFVSNNLKRTFPLGLDLEVFSFKTLENACLEAKTAFEREHVTPYIRNNPQKFHIANVENEIDLSNLRWTVDYEEDYEFVKAVYENLYEKKGVFLMNDILRLLVEKPEIAEINKSAR
jgi:spore coat polysaccharide biosynthesis protein SpsF